MKKIYEEKQFIVLLEFRSCDLHKTHVKHIILLNFLIHKKISKHDVVISKDIDNYNKLWICTEMVEQKIKKIKTLSQNSKT